MSLRLGGTSAIPLFLPGYPCTLLQGRPSGTVCSARSFCCSSRSWPHSPTCRLYRLPPPAGGRTAHPAERELSQRSQTSGTPNFARRRRPFVRHLSLESFHKFHVLLDLFPELLKGFWPLLGLQESLLDWLAKFLHKRTFSCSMVSDTQRYSPITAEQVNVARLTGMKGTLFSLPKAAEPYQIAEPCRARGTSQT